MYPNFLEEFESLKQKTESLKAEFKDFIVDKDIPLEDRWKVFKKAPSELIDNLDYVDNELLNQLLTDRGKAYHDSFTNLAINYFGYEKNNTVYLEDLIPIGIGENPSKWFIAPTKFKEFLLEHNLSTVTLDW